MTMFVPGMARDRRIRIPLVDQCAVRSVFSAGFPFEPATPLARLHSRLYQYLIVSPIDSRLQRHVTHPMSINWNQLRLWNGDRRNAFEELCCQLAAAESFPSRSQFIRKGTPDAGVECYWRLPSNEEWCLQAKFFQQQLTSTQWKELDDSFYTALAAHPHLTTYVVCLPQNLPDGRVGRSVSARERWEKRREAWVATAAKCKRAIDVELWDETQIGLRLARPEHQGIHWFWFDSEQRFTLDWFHDRLEEAVKNAGDRYTPKVHVKLPIARCFSGLGRCPEYRGRIEELITDLHRRHRDLHRAKHDPQVEAGFRRIDSRVADLSDALHTVVGQLATDAATALPLACIAERVQSLVTEARPLSDKCYDLAIAADSQKPPDADNTYYRNPLAESFRSSCYRLRELMSAASDVDVFISSVDSQLTNLPAFLLEGAAGQGKTHLLCDVAERDVAAGRPRLLLHGGHFQAGEPWQQIIALLGLNCSAEQFLGGLQACAQAHRCRVVILIDAINEGAGPTLWRQHIPGFLARIRKYPWLGVCMTVRSTYTDLLIGPEIADDTLLREAHHGFDEHEQEAVERFFREYGIVPTYPLLVPEFSNPLFLKLFCTAIKNHGLNHVPPGIRGITSLLELFVDSVNKKLSRPEVLDFNENDRLVQRAVDRLCRAMADNSAEYLPRHVAESLVNADRHEATYSKSLFAHLVHEGLLNVDRWKTGDEYHEIVHIAYQRFTDHLVAKHLLDTHLDPREPQKAFRKRSPLGRLFSQPHFEWRHRGLVEALSVQLPERVGAELVTLFPALADSDVARRAFVESVVWRASRAFGKDAGEYINKKVLRYRGTAYEFLEAMLTVAPIPDHPYNADRLHSHLQGLSLPARDAWWSIFLHERYGDSGAISRLVRWAWSGIGHEHLSDEVIRLSATALAWLFTTSNRFLRDSATKALVTLASVRPKCLIPLINAFKDVNDPYVSERLYASAYGSAMRSRDVHGVNELAVEVYRHVFERREPPVHIRLRDYARGIVELALTQRADLPVDIERVRPPYRSSWPGRKPASDKELTRRMSSKSSDDAKRAVYWLVNSIKSDMEDFSRYVIDDLHEWSNVRLGEEPPPTREEKVRQFEQTLSVRQRNAYDTLCRIRQYLDRPEVLAKRLKQKVTSEQILEWAKQAESSLRKLLRRNTAKLRAYEKSVRPYLEHPYGDDRRFDAKFARQWILDRVVELGWTAARFGEFDQMVNRYRDVGRSDHKAERIGKKYQWIAYCELQARIADNFQMKCNFSSWEEDDEYHGPWQVNRGRDIDPSMVLKSTKRNNWQPSSNCWWFQYEYSPWDSGQSHIAWLRRTSDLPNPAELIGVTCRRDGIKWLVLQGYFCWEEPTPLREERFECARRELRYWIRGYLVRKRDAAKCLKWIAAQQHIGQLLHENQGEYALFLGEFFWSPAFAGMDNAYNGRPGWTKGNRSDMPCEILGVSEKYVREAGSLDCSIDETIFVEFPCKQIVSGMNLRWGGRTSAYVDGNDNVIALDPSVHEKGPGCLLIREAEFLAYLRSAELELFWIVCGEKMRIGGSHRPDDYLGRLDIEGCYRVVNGQINGKLKAKFKPRE